MEKIWNQERDYCLKCINKPCSNKGCPLQNDIPSFIHEEDPEKAFEILCKTTVLPAICGKICPHSKQCQGSCVRGIKGKPVSIGKVESYIGDLSIEKDYKIPKADLLELGKKFNKNENEIKEKLKKIKIAVIGSGPCGLTCASFLAKYGIQVTIFEKYEKLGGLLRHGIPEFRLERKTVEKTIEKIIEQGIIVKNNTEFGKDINIEKLLREYDGIFISIGANVSNKTIQSENTINSNEFLEQLNVIQEKYNKKIDDLDEKMKLTKNEKEFVNLVKELKKSNVAVQGGGNVAMDISRTLVRLGTNVTIVYRRDIEQMPAEKYEIEDAKSEGVKILVKTNIKDFNSANHKLKCIKTKLVKDDNDTRLSPKDIEGSEFDLAVDYLVFAIGSKIEESIIKKEGLEQNKWGYINVNEEFETSIKNVFAGGDAIGTNSTVAYAAMNGRQAAKCIIRKYI